MPAEDSNMRHDPAQIIGKLLIDNELVDPHDAINAIWPVYSNFLPKPNGTDTGRACGVFSTTPILLSREHDRMTQEDRGAIQIRVQSLDQMEINRKLIQIRDFLLSVLDEEVCVDYDWYYTIHAFQLTTGILNMGEDPDTKLRSSTINATFS